MISPADIGRHAEHIAQTLWRIRMTELGGSMDRMGIDGVDAETGARLQIKGDVRIHETGNVYVERYEKTKYQNGQRWRSSPHICDEYIFVTCGFAIRIPLNDMAELEIGQPITRITSTSIGVLISVTFFQPYIRWHDLWPPTKPARFAIQRSYLTGQHGGRVVFPADGMTVPTQYALWLEAQRDDLG